MRVLLLTVAGISSRFSASLGRETIKCLYNNNSKKESLLFQMLSRHEFFDYIIIVGGYRFKALKCRGMELIPKCNNKILWVENKRYNEYGSGYSFYEGIRVLKKIKFDELVFAEGDLLFDEISFEKICKSSKNVITYCKEPIEADKAVAFYIKRDGKPHYIYDTGHRMLEISEPFEAIYNSGQVWKFSDRELFSDIVLNMPEDDFKGTNLVPINKYFSQVLPNKVDYICFNTWFNCNTLNDFNNAMKTMKKEDLNEKYW